MMNPLSVEPSQKLPECIDARAERMEYTSHVAGPVHHSCQQMPERTFLFSLFNRSIENLSY